MAPYHGYLYNNLSCLEDKGCWCTLRHLLWWKCLYMTYRKIRLIINHKKDIEFTDSGLSIYGAKEIMWREIADFDLIRFKGNRLITIQMKNPTEVLASEPSWIKRKTMEYNLKTINANYAFPAYLIDGRAEEALALCKEKLAEHQ